jgi:hypothetical protein
MTKITFYKKNELFLGFQVEGHTGKDVYGKDLLCCQISTVAQLGLVGIKEVANIKCEFKVRDGFLKVKVGEIDAKREDVQFLFKTCLESFGSIIIDEKKYVKLEVENV